MNFVELKSSLKYMQTMETIVVELAEILLIYLIVNLCRKIIANCGNNCCLINWNFRCFNYKIYLV